MDDADARGGYFAAQGDGEAVAPDPSFPHVFTSAAEIPFADLGEGLRFKPVFGRNLLLNHVYFAPHAGAPAHRHPEEQMGVVLEGELEFEIAGETRVARAGDMWVIPPNAPHSARALENGCVALDIFAPPRSGFREALARVGWTGDPGPGASRPASDPMM